MRTIYDRMDETESPDTPVSYKEAEVSPSVSSYGIEKSAEVSDLPTKNISIQEAGNNAELEKLAQRSEAAMLMVDDIVLRNYIAKLSELSIVPLQNRDIEDIILFKVNKMVYEKDEYATDKFISVISAMTYTKSSIFMIVDGHETHTDFYLGIKSNDEIRERSSIAKTLESSLLGQFPGAIIEDYSTIKPGKDKAPQERILNRLSEATCISSCVGVPSYKNSKGEYTNANFIQGLEKFATAMHGKRYTAIILATNLPHNEVAKLRSSYEEIYAELSAMSTRQLAYSTNESLANAFNRTRGFSDTDSFSRTKGTSDSISHSESHTEGFSETLTTTKTETEGISKDNFWKKFGNLADPLAEAGAILCGTGVGAPLGAIMMIGGGVAGVGSVVGGATKTKSKSISEATAFGRQTSDTTTQGNTHTENYSKTKGSSHTEQFSESDGTTSTVGNSKNFTVTVQNKRIQDVLKRIDKQLERLDVCEGTGLWSAGAYFLSYGTDRATAEIGATIFRSIMQGEQSGVECSAINTWNFDGGNEFKSLVNYVGSLSHPMFDYTLPALNVNMSVLPTSMLSSKELAILMGLPRKSVPGLPVIEHISLGKEVVRINKEEDSGDKIELGCIFDQGVERKDNKVKLDVKSLTQHTFVTGSTGCGKSNTIYYLLNHLRKLPSEPKILVIEPAKGEYKDVFGDMKVYGTNPLISNLLKINPFKFPDGVHVLEHVDRLIEIFNVCWPMYAAMPAVLKEAVLNAYEDCGWDLIKSTNKYSGNIFPTFSDLIWELETVIELSDYSEEVKSNYKGSLVTRVKSLANGINGEIFSGVEIGDHILFDQNVIVDISRIGSLETKALIMGILIMRLNEYRANSGVEANSNLRHVTIIEEAHNLLKRCSQEQNPEGSNLAGKSVEMISNAIAEMRTYGEGFIIVDQSPGAVDISAIRNTNTKIIMRLPEESDRKVAGKSSGMKDSQIDEIAKLPTGVAVVYQNDWEEPVLCKVERYNGDRLKYEFKEEMPSALNTDELVIEILKYLFQTKISTPLPFNIDLIKQELSSSTLPTYVKINVLEAIHEYECNEPIALWDNNEFVKFSWIVSGILGLKQQVSKLANRSINYDELTEGLKNLIHGKIKNLPSELDMPILQSLMRDYSTGGEARLQRYGEWLKTARERIK